MAHDGTDGVGADQCWPSSRLAQTVQERAGALIRQAHGAGGLAEDDATMPLQHQEQDGRGPLLARLEPVANRPAAGAVTAADPVLLSAPPASHQPWW